MSRYSTYEAAKTLLISECSEMLSRISSDEVDAFIAHLCHAEKVFFVGVGRVLLSMEAMAKRFAHLGINAIVVGQITEPAITNHDVLIVGSGSGESVYPVDIARKAKTIGASILYIGSNRDSTIGKMADATIRIPARTKLYRQDEYDSEQPMSSLFEQCLLLLGDAIALILISRNNINLKDLWKCHANLE
jgi:6-phospho-3-hexuloisomerase